MSKKLIPKRSSLFIILVTTFCILTMPWPISGEIRAMGGNATINIAPHNSTVTQYTEFDVKIRIYPEGTIAGMQCDFHYDPMLLNATEVAEGNLFDGISSYFNPGTIDNINGTITGMSTAITTPGGSVSEPGEFAIITLTSLDSAGTSPLDISNVIVGDKNANPLSLLINNGTATVEIEPSKIKTAPSHLTVEQDAFFEVNINLEPAEDIWGVQFDITFDPDEITADNVSYGGIFGTNKMFIPGTINNAAGHINDIFCGHPGPGGESTYGTIAIITFSVSTTARGSPIDISDVVMFDADSEQIPPTRYTVENGSVTVDIDATMVAISPSASTVNQKELFTVDIAVTPGTVIAGVQADILYDSSRVHAVNVTKGDLFDSYFNNETAIDNAEGKITGIACVSTTPGGVTTPGTLATITFESLLKGGTAFISLSHVVVGDPYGITVPSITDNGSVTIELEYTGIYIDPAAQTVKQEETFTVDVVVDPKGEIAGVEFDVLFDPVLITAENITYGGFFGSENVTALFIPGEINNTHGVIKDCRAVYLGEGGVTSQGTVAVITFTSKLGSGTSFISISNVIIGDSEAQPVPVEITHGSVDVILEHIFDLRQGWNLITLPVQHTYTAETLGQAIPLCDTIAMWDVTNQSYLAHPVGTVVHDFEIMDGIGYFVHLTGDATFTVTGVLIGNVSVTVQPGWNLIGWKNIANTTAESIGESILNCDTILGWDVTAQEYIGHPVGTAIHDFNVSMGHALFIHTSSESTWYGK